MGWARALFWLFPRRLRSYWVLLAITSFGILAAVTLMAVGAIYSRALAEGGLQHILASTSTTVMNSRVTVRDRPIGTADYQKLRADVEEIGEARLGFMIRDIQRYGLSQTNMTLAFSSEPGPPRRGSPSGRPFFLTDFESHTRLLEGRWPIAAPVFQEKVLVMEAVLGARAASSIAFKQLSEGNQIHLMPFLTEPGKRITLNIVGLVEPIDTREEYWMNSSSYFDVQEINQRIVVPIYLSEDTYFGGLGSRYPSMVGTFGWYFYLDTGVLTADLAGPTKDAVLGLDKDINKRFPGSFILSGLGNTIDDYQTQLTLAKIPLFLFISLVVLIILYFLALVMGLMARSRSDEAGLLRSRGGGLLQISQLLVVGEGVVVLAAMVVGPFLALAIVRFLLLETINPEGGGSDAFSVGFSWDMFLMGAIGGILSLLVLMFSAVNRARLGMVESLRARTRPPSLPFIHRYYIDVLVLAAIGLLWWQIRQRGGFVEGDLASQSLDVDPLLLFIPALVLLGAAMLMLRVLPFVVRALAWVSVRLGPAWVALSLVRLSRDPLPHGALIVILMLATAVGVFGAGFQSTLSRSQQEQALYKVGGDLVIKSNRIRDATMEQLSSLAGVRDVSPIIRTRAIMLGQFSGNSADLLAVEPESLPNAAWFRDDFAGKTLSQLLEPLRAGRPVLGGSGQGPTPGIAIPRGAETIGVWVNLDNLDFENARQSLNLWARVYDANGRFATVFVGDLFSAAPGSAQDFGRTRFTREAGSQFEGSGVGWVYFEGALPDASSPLEPPLNLVAFYNSSSPSSRVPPGSFSLDDVTVKGPSIPTEGEVIEGFEKPGPWAALPIRGPVADTVEPSSQAARTGGGALTFSWNEPASGSSRGIHIPAGPFPLPAVGDSAFQVGQQVLLNVDRHLVPVVIMDVTDFFPTLYPSTSRFVIVDLNDFQQYIRRIPSGNLLSPAEMWLSLNEEVDRGPLVQSVRDVLPDIIFIRDRAAEEDQARRDPLAGGGWNGLTILSMSAIAVAVVLTLIIHAVVSVHTGRVDLTVAWALGLSRMQIFFALALDSLVVAVLGIAAGTALGIWPGGSLLGSLDLTEGGGPSVPPMVPTMHEWLLVLVLGSLVAASILGLVFAAVFARRLRLPEILRAGE